MAKLDVHEMNDVQKADAVYKALNELAAIYAARVRMVAEPLEVIREAMNEREQEVLVLAEHARHALQERLAARMARDLNQQAKQTQVTLLSLHTEAERAVEALKARLFSTPPGPTTHPQAMVAAALSLLQGMHK
jgi:hypothetical protein